MSYTPISILYRCAVAEKNELEPIELEATASAYPALRHSVRVPVYFYTLRRQDWADCF